MKNLSGKQVSVTVVFNKDKENLKYIEIFQAKENKVIASFYKENFKTVHVSLNQKASKEIQVPHHLQNAEPFVIIIEERDIRLERGSGDLWIDLQTIYGPAVWATLILSVLTNGFFLKISRLNRQSRRTPDRVI